MSELVKRNLELLEKNGKMKQKLSKIAVLCTGKIDEKCGNFDWLKSKEFELLKEIIEIIED